MIRIFRDKTDNLKHLRLLLVSPTMDPAGTAFGPESMAKVTTHSMKGLLQ